MIKGKEKTSTITLTFGDMAENHVGMQKIGSMAKEGFSYSDLQTIQKTFLEKGTECELKDLVSSADLSGPDIDGIEPAHILIIRKGVDSLLQSRSIDDLLLQEQEQLDVDKKALMYGRVVHKHARHNLCFDEKAQDPDYAKGRGRVVAYSEVPLTQRLRNHLALACGPKASNLTCEGNYYYDIKKCGIGWHGDSERVFLYVSSGSEIGSRWGKGSILNCIMETCTSCLKRLLVQTGKEPRLPRCRL